MSINGSQSDEATRRRGHSVVDRTVSSVTYHVFRTCVVEDNPTSHVQVASPQTLEAGVIALTQLLGDVKKRVENLDNLIIPEAND